LADEKYRSVLTHILTIKPQLEEIKKELSLIIKKGLYKTLSSNDKKKLPRRDARLMYLIGVLWALAKKSGSTLGARADIVKTLHSLPNGYENAWKIQHNHLAGLLSNIRLDSMLRLFRTIQTSQVRDGIWDNRGIQLKTRGWVYDSTGNEHVLMADDKPTDGRKRHLLTAIKDLSIFDNNLQSSPKPLDVKPLFSESDGNNCKMVFKDGPRIAYWPLYKISAQINRLPKRSLGPTTGMTYIDDYIAFKKSAQH